MLQTGSNLPSMSGGKPLVPHFFKNQCSLSNHATQINANLCDRFIRETKPVSPETGGFSLPWLFCGSVIFDIPGQIILWQVLWSLIVCLSSQVPSNPLLSCFHSASIYQDCFTRTQVSTWCCCDNPRPACAVLLARKQSGYGTKMNQVPGALRSPSCPLPATFVRQHIFWCGPCGLSQSYNSTN